MVAAYYNEHDPYAAAWLRNLISAGHIAPGDVDERDIRDVRPEDLRNYVQCHFFAGIGVWSYALRGAGFPDNRQVWTGSCPCQPFSQAGQGGGFDDERHLWPAFHYLIEKCGPRLVFGEQVASQDGLAWLDLVQADMEAADYAFGALDICAAGFGAPHIRQRLYWVADADRRECGRFADSEGRFAYWPTPRREQGDGVVEPSSAVRLVVDADDAGPQGRSGMPQRPDQLAAGPRGVVGELGDADSGGRPSRQHGTEATRHGHPAFAASDRSPTGPVNGVWRDADWLLCRDGKWRPVRSGSFPLAHGAPSRVGRLRAYGNAIVAAQAEEFIRAAMAYAP
jgi:DNA (cytosine-5)-methyltransferase 1